MPTRIKAAERVVRYVPSEQIKPNPWNRTLFDPEALEELAKSIRAEGIREPLILRSLGHDRYEIASGNRRWLAAKKVGLEKLPCLVETLSDEQVAEDNIVMNIQREDIPPLELARMVQAYMKTFNKKQKDAARTFGKSKTWVSQLLSFLEMAPPDAVKKFRALNLGWDALQAIKSLGTDLASIIAKELVDGSLTTRRIIKRCNQLLYGRHNSKGGFKKGAPPPADPLRSAWESVRSEVLKASRVSWELQYGARKMSNGRTQEGWYFFASPLMGEPKEALADWFIQMGRALQGKKVKEPIPQDLQAMKQAGKALVKRHGPRLPKNAAEQAELAEIAAKQGPKAVYAWIYGADSFMTKAVPASTWKEMGMTATDGLHRVLDGIRSFQKHRT